MPPYMQNGIQMNIQTDIIIEIAVGRQELQIKQGHMGRHLQRHQIQHIHTIHQMVGVYTAGCITILLEQEELMQQTQA